MYDTEQHILQNADSLNKNVKEFKSTLQHINAYQNKLAQSASAVLMSCDFRRCDSQPPGSRYMTTMAPEIEGELLVDDDCELYFDEDFQVPFDAHLMPGMLPMHQHELELNNNVGLAQCSALSNQWNSGICTRYSQEHVYLQNPREVFLISDDDEEVEEEIDELFMKEPLFAPIAFDNECHLLRSYQSNMGLSTTFNHALHNLLSQHDCDGNRYALTAMSESTRRLQQMAASDDSVDCNDVMSSRTTTKDMATGSYTTTEAFVRSSKSSELCCDLLTGKRIPLHYSSLNDIQEVKLMSQHQLESIYCKLSAWKCLKLVANNHLMSWNQIRSVIQNTDVPCPIARRVRSFPQSCSSFRAQSDRKRCYSTTLLEIFKRCHAYHDKEKQSNLMYNSDKTKMTAAAVMTAEPSSIGRGNRKLNGNKRAKTALILPRAIHLLGTSPSEECEAGRCNDDMMNVDQWCEQPMHNKENFEVNVRHFGVQCPQDAADDVNKLAPFAHVIRRAQMSSINNAPHSRPLSVPAIVGANRFSYLGTPRNFRILTSSMLGPLPDLSFLRKTPPIDREAEKVLRNPLSKTSSTDSPQTSDSGIETVVMPTPVIGNLNDHVPFSRRSSHPLRYCAQNMDLCSHAKRLPITAQFSTFSTMDYHLSEIGTSAMADSARKPCLKVCSLERNRNTCAEEEQRMCGNASTELSSQSSTDSSDSAAVVDSSNESLPQTFRAKKSVSFSERIQFHSSPLQNCCCFDETYESFRTCDVHFQHRLSVNLDFKVIPVDVGLYGEESPPTEFRASPSTSPVGRILMSTADGCSDIAHQAHCQDGTNGLHVGVVGHAVVVNPSVDSKSREKESAVQRQERYRNLVSNIIRAVDEIFICQQMGFVDDSFAKSRDVHLAVQSSLCPPLHALLSDGLLPSGRASRLSFSTKIYCPLWQLIEESCRAGPPTNQLLNETFTTVRSIVGLTTERLKFNTFVCACLNSRVLNYWLTSLVRQEACLKRFYRVTAFIRQCHAEQCELFADLTTSLQLLQSAHFALSLHSTALAVQPPAADCSSNPSQPLKTTPRDPSRSSQTTTARTLCKATSATTQSKSAPTERAAQCRDQTSLASVPVNAKGGRLRNAFCNMRQRTEGVIRRAQSARLHQNRSNTVVAGVVVLKTSPTTTSEQNLSSFANPLIKNSSSSKTSNNG